MSSEHADVGRDTEPVTGVELARARTTFARAQMRLRAAEEDYAKARTALAAQLARRGAAAPLPIRQLHYLCGHAEMRPDERASGSLLSLCPDCQRLYETHALLFAPVISLMMPRDGFE
jgi:hypothetical protein